MYIRILNTPHVVIVEDLINDKHTTINTVNVASKI